MKKLKKKRQAIANQLSTSEFVMAKSDNKLDSIKLPKKTKNQQPKKENKLIYN